MSSQPGGRATGCSSSPFRSAPLPAAPTDIAAERLTISNWVRWLDHGICLIESERFPTHIHRQNGSNLNGRAQSLKQKAVKAPGIGIRNGLGWGTS